MSDKQMDEVGMSNPQVREDVRVRGMPYEIDRMHLTQRFSYDLAHRLIAAQRAPDQTKRAIAPSSKMHVFKLSLGLMMPTFVPLGIWLLLLGCTVFLFASG